MRSVLAVGPVLLLNLLASACSEPAGPAAPARLVIEPGGELRSLLIGSWEQLTARALTASGRDAGPVTVTWSIDNKEVGSIDTRGELRLASSYTACGWVTPGQCTVRVTARAGGLVAEQLITVLPYTPVLTVGVRQIDLEMGDSVRLDARVRLEGRDVPWCALSFASRDPAIASVDAGRGVIKGGDEGTTFIDVAVSGPGCPTDATPVQVINRPPWHTLTILPDTEAVLPPGAALQLIAQVRNGKGVEYAAIATQWSSSDPAVASVEHGLVRALACGAPPCRVTITVRSGRLTATKLIVVE